LPWEEEQIMIETIGGRSDGAAISTIGGVAQEEWDWASEWYQHGSD
jgi:hypothetical protein